jgi:hypothetical protein
MKLATQLNLVTRQKMVELYVHFLVLLHGVMSNELRKGETLPLPCRISFEKFVITYLLKKFPFVYNTMFFIEPPFCHIVSQMNSIPTYRSCFFKTHFNTVCPPNSISLNLALLKRSSQRMLYSSLNYSLQSSHIFHVILFDLYSSPTAPYNLHISSMSSFLICIHLQLLLAIFTYLPSYPL